LCFSFLCCPASVHPYASSQSEAFSGPLIVSVLLFSERKRVLCMHASIDSNIFILFVAIVRERLSKDHPNILSFPFLKYISSH
jgi:hypothetical protein